jgi:hypothetical protein
MTQPVEHEPLLPPDADPLLGPILSGLHACLCATLTAAERPVCSCCLTWGERLPALDWCGCDCDGGHGQAWVRWVRRDPVADLGGNRRTSCGCLSWRGRHVIELGVTRCVAVTGPDGQSAPDCQQRAAEFWGFLADARLLREAVVCCSALQDVTVEPDSERPLGPQGGCAGVLLTITVEA